MEAWQDLNKHDIHDEAFLTDGETAGTVDVMGRHDSTSGGYPVLAHCYDRKVAQKICDLLNMEARRAAYSPKHQPQAAKGCGPVSYRQQA